MIGEVSRGILDLNPEVLAFDVLFSEPTHRNALKRLSQLNLGLPAKEKSKVTQELAHFLDDDAAFVASLNQTSSVVLGYYVDSFKSSGYVHKLQKPGLYALASQEIPAEKQQNHFLTSLSDIQKVSSGEGFLNIYPELDGYFRRIPLAYWNDKQEGLLPFAFSVLAEAGSGEFDLKLNAKGGIEKVFLRGATYDLKKAQWFHRRNRKLCKRRKRSCSPAHYSSGKPVLGGALMKASLEHFVEIPFVAPSAFMVNPRGPAGTYKTFSAVDFLDGKIPRREIEGKIVFFGATAVGTYDIRPVVYDASFPGVELHASVLGGVLKGDFLKGLPGGDFWFWVIYGVMALVVFLLFLFLGSLWQFLLFLSVLLGLFVGLFWALEVHGYWAGWLVSFVGLVFLLCILLFGQFYF